MELFFVDEVGVSNSVGRLSFQSCQITYVLPFAPIGKILCSQRERWVSIGNRVSDILVQFSRVHILRNILNHLLGRLFAVDANWLLGNIDTIFIWGVRDAAVVAVPSTALPERASRLVLNRVGELKEIRVESVRLLVIIHCPCTAVIDDELGFSRLESVCLGGSIKDLINIVLFTLIIQERCPCLKNTFFLGLGLLD